MRQIYKVTDNVFDTLTIISQDDDDLSHDNFCRLLLQEQAVQELVFVKNNDKQGKQEQETSIVEPPSVSSYIHDTYTDLASHMSSVILTPLTKLAISSGK